MKVGDLVCDPFIMKKWPCKTVDRTLGVIINDESCDLDFQGKSYCSCEENKWAVWWMGVNTTFWQCACELRVINESR